MKPNIAERRLTGPEESTLKMHLLALENEYPTFIGIVEKLFESEEANRGEVERQAEEIERLNTALEQVLRHLEHERYMSAEDEAREALQQ